MSIFPPETIPWEDLCLSLCLSPLLLQNRECEHQIFYHQKEGKVKPTFLFSGVCSFVSMVYYFLIKNTLKFLVTSSYDSSASWLTIQVILFFWEYV